jgi:U4/U6.U5 tri-snRNP component SNU23
MSQNLNYKQAANVERRTWDKDTYEAKAKARSQAEQSGGSNKGPVRQPVGEKRKLGDDDDNKEEFTPAAAGAAGPEKSERAFLKARKSKVDIDSKVGSTEMVSAEAAATTATGDIADGVTKTGVGWHCKVCDCFLKDSHTYLDHINGRKHQRSLGFSMRVERSTTEQVQDRLQKLVKRQEPDPVEEQLSAADILKAKDEELRQRKEERAKKREERKNKVKQQHIGDDEEEEPQMDPAMAAMMGFSGFGGGNKRR